MIRKLRMKLIFAAMLSLFIVLSVTLAIAGMLNYRQVVSTADSTLSILVENDGKFPENYDSESKNDFLNSPELPYESRFFFVALSEDGEVISTNTEQIAAIDADEASEIAKKIWESGKSKGFVGDYRFAAYTSKSEFHVVFLDCRRSLSTAKNFVVITVIVAATGLGIVLVLLLVISGTVVKPFSENFEKQRRFITDAGHELKTPLAIINADTEILEMDFGENEWLSDIQKQTKQLTDLTNNLILLSRMEESQSKTQMMEFSISEVTDKTAVSFQALARSQGKTLETEIEPDLMMRGDEKAIGRLITILLDNAVKYSQPEGKILLTLKKQWTSVRLTVYNTAELVSKESLPHFFDRFYRADESRNSQTGGYGLGLSIAASTVSAHKGKITASTEDEKSLLITVILPT